MPFTLITITGGPFTRPDGQPAQGKLTATLSEPMQNGTQLVDPTPITGVLNPAGMLKDSTGVQALTLEANDDVGTTPLTPPASYEFVLTLDVAGPDPFRAVISHSAPGATVDLSALV